MPLEFIYIMYAGFLIFARDVASNNGRRRLFKNLKRGRWSLARAGGSQEMTRVFFHSLRFQTVKHASTVGQGMWTWDFAPGSWVRSLWAPVFILFPKLALFSIFSYFNIFAYYLISFHNFISASKNHQNNFFFLHYFHKIFI
jgi:hypothetical protein